MSHLLDTSSDDSSSSSDDEYSESRTDSDKSESEETGSDSECESESSSDEEESEENGQGEGVSEAPQEETQQEEEDDDVEIYVCGGCKKQLRYNGDLPAFWTQSSKYFDQDGVGMWFCGMNHNECKRNYIKGLKIKRIKESNKRILAERKEKRALRIKKRRMFGFL